MKLAGSFGCFTDDLPAQREDAELVLEGLVSLQALIPALGLKQQLLARLGFEGEELDVTDLPVINKYANYLSWKKITEPFLPEVAVETIYMNEFRRDSKVVQNLVVTKINVPEEIHETYSESFFILEGSCVCTINKQVFQLGPGDFLPIPLYTPHDVQLLSPQVTAIVQYELG